MIKAKEAAIKPTLALPDSYTTVLMPLVNHEYANAVQYAEYHKGCIATYTNDIEHIQAAKEKEEQELQKHTAKLGSFDISDLELRAKKLRLQLMRIVELQNVVVNNGALRIYTHPLFTMIRTADGSRTNKRRCLGAFRVDISLTENTFTVRQELFTNASRTHWAISGGGGACLGNWEPQYRELQGTGDWVGMVKMILLYLRDTHDAGAYIRSHIWVAERDQRYAPQDTYLTLKVGDAVIGRNNDRMGIVTMTHPDDSRYVRISMWKQGDNTSLPSNDWLDTRYYYKITKLQYRPMTDIPWATIREAAKRKHEQNKTKSPLEQIDSAPDGTTLEVLQAILSKV